MSEGFRIGVMYESELLGSSHGGMGRVLGVTRDCYFLKWLCDVSRMVWGCEVICPVVGSVMVDRFGWAFALGCNPAAVFRVVVVSFGALFV